MDTAHETRPPGGPPPPGSRFPLGALTRATDDKVISGLCGGLGRHFGIDPLVFRIAFVVMSLAGGTGVILYLVGWALVPDDEGRAFGVGWLPGKDRGQKLVAAALAGCGLLLLIDRITDGHGDDIPLGLVLVGLGAAVLWSRRRGDPPTPPPAPPGPPGGATPAAADGGEPEALSATQTVEPEVEATPTTTTTPTTPTTPPAAPPPAGSPVATPPKAPKPRSALVVVTLSLLAILAGILTLAGTDVVTGLALALLLVAGAMVVGAWRGRARGLIPVAVVLSGALFVASLLDVPMKGGIGDRRYTPATVEEVGSPYRLAMGELRVDLRQVDLTGRTLPVVVSNGVGTVVVTVPSGAAIEVDGYVGAGELIVFDRRWEGAGIDERVVTGGREGGGRLVLDARVGLGELEVRRAEA